MLSLSLTLIGIEVLLLKYGLMSWLDSIQASGVMATFVLLINLVLKHIFGNCAY